MRKPRFGLGAVLALALAACATYGGGKPASTPAAAAGKKSLYDRLGGKAAISAVVEDFVGRVGKDARINKFFATTDLANLKKQLVDQICEASGGPCKYKGGNMKAVHVGLGIANPDFDALVEDLVQALDHFKIGKPEKDDLLAVLGPMRGDIVEKK